MKKRFFYSTILLCASVSVFAAGPDLGGAIKSAGQSLNGVREGIATLLYALAGIIGLFGAIRVYSKHQNGDQDTQKAMGQFGFAFIFLIAAGLLINAMFPATS